MSKKISFKKGFKIIQWCSLSDAPVPSIKKTVPQHDANTTMLDT